MQKQADSNVPKSAQNDYISSYTKLRNNCALGKKSTAVQTGYVFIYTVSNILSLEVLQFLRRTEAFPSTKSGAVARRVGFSPAPPPDATHFPRSRLGSRESEGRRSVEHPALLYTFSGSQARARNALPGTTPLMYRPPKKKRPSRRRRFCPKKRALLFFSISWLLERRGNSYEEEGRGNGRMTNETAFRQALRASSCDFCGV